MQASIRACSTIRFSAKREIDQYAIKCYFCKRPNLNLQQFLIFQDSREAIIHLLLSLKSCCWALNATFPLQSLTFYALLRLKSSFGMSLLMISSSSSSSPSTWKQALPTPASREREARRVVTAAASVPSFPPASPLLAGIRSANSGDSERKLRTRERRMEEKRMRREDGSWKERRKMAKCRWKEGRFLTVEKVLSS